MQRHKLYGYRRGGTFESPKVPKSDLGLRPKDPTLVGRNLRLSRADPMLCFGQPSPLQCILLSPQGLATLRGPICPDRKVYDLPDLGLDDAYKVFILIRFLLGPK